MGQITVSAKTLDEAITKALIELQTTSEHLHYDVIQSATTGIFGLFGGKPCVIRARVMSAAEEQAKKKAVEEKKQEEKKQREIKKAEEEKKASLQTAKEAPVASVKTKEKAPSRTVEEKKSSDPAEKPVEKSSLPVSSIPGKNVSEKAAEEVYPVSETEEKSEYENANAYKAKYSER
ncbi:MAG: Jag N-terminal domain-containing protein [Clostridiales bacterium]|nr:Jag N-terminal domain-containing protein [Clostridiales bacterium]